MRWSNLTLQPVCQCLLPTLFFLYIIFLFCSPDSLGFYFLFMLERVIFISQMMCRGPDEWQFGLDVILCLLCLEAESSFRPWSRRTGSVELWLHKWSTRLRVYCDYPYRDEGLLPSADIGRGYVSVQSVYQYSFYLSCHWWILLFYSPWSRDLY